MKVRAVGHKEARLCTVSQRGHRWEPLLGRELRDLTSVDADRRVPDDQKPGGTLRSHRLKGPVDRVTPRSFDLHRENSYTQRRRCGLSGLQLVRADRAVGVE